MANKKINELAIYTGNTSGAILIMNDSTETNTFKVTKEKLNEGLISGSSQVLNGSNVWSSSVQLPSGIISGSSQLPSGLVSGSPQISYTGITDKPSGLVSGSSQILNGSGIWSGSAQLPLGIVSGSSQVLNGSGVWSSSAQLPSGVVSGSSQVDHNLTTNFVTNKHIDHTAVTISGTTGLIGGGDITTSRNISLDTTSPTFNDGIKTKMNTENVISCSLQITNYGFSTTGSNNIVGNEVISGSLVVTGSVTIVGSITERLVLKPGSGSVAINFDYNSGSIFYLSGSLGTNTFNVQNMPTTANRSTALTFVIEQGTTPYSASAYQFDGIAQTVKWSNGAIPAGNANKTDVIGLTAFRSGSSWNILGTLSTFG